MDVLKLGWERVDVLRIISLDLVKRDLLNKVTYWRWPALGLTCILDIRTTHAQFLPRGIQVWL